MSSKARQTSRRGLANADLTRWPDVESLAVEEAFKVRYHQNKLAVELYAQNAALSEIEIRCRISKQGLYLLVDRCKTLATDGQVWGFRACVPNVQVVLARRHDLSKLDAGQAVAGSLGALLTLYPTIKDSLEKYISTGARIGRKAKEKQISTKTAHSYFIELCHDFGVPPGRYPFNSKSLGEPALAEYFRTFKSKLGEQFRVPLDPTLVGLTAPRGVYEVVEVDGHQIDYHCAINVGDPETGAEHWVEVTRFWIIAVVDVVSTATLGYSISFGTKNYSEVDFIKALKNSVKPWKRRKLSVENVNYGPDDGFPSGLIRDLEFACFDEVRFDNSKVHLSMASLHEIEANIGARVVMGPPATPNSRPNIEGLFRILEEAGLRRLHGSQLPVGGKRKTHRSADQVKIPRLLEQELYDATDLILARKNATPVAVTGLAPLSYLRKQVDARDQIIRHIPIDLRSSFTSFDYFKDGKISRDDGVPVIRFLGARYYSKKIVDQMVGRDILVKADSADLRTIDVAIKGSGQVIPGLVVERRYRSTSHSVQTRKQIIALQKEGWTTQFEDIVEGFNETIHKRAKQGQAKAAGVLARLRAEKRDSDESRESSPRPKVESAATVSEDEDIAELRRKYENSVPIQRR